MSDIRDDEHENHKPLQAPVEEDGIVREDGKGPDGEELDEDPGGLDGGLADIGSGKRDERKITG